MALTQIQMPYTRLNAQVCSARCLLDTHACSSFRAVPDMVREAEAVMLRRQAAESGRPANVLEKMVLGRLNK